MLIITSPAKSLDFERKYNISETQPQFLDESEHIVSILSQYSSNELKKLFGVSEKIANLNHERFKSWNKLHDSSNSRTAISAYNGDIYKQIDKESYDKANWKYINQSLRIPTGLYGVLRPTDLIQPYRLEMGTKMSIDGFNNLYKFWGDKITNSLNKDIEKYKHKYLINLASEEYYNSVSFDQIVVPVINIEFRQIKDGVMKNFGILAKIARGKMINFMAKNLVKDIDGIKQFDADGYKFLKEESNNIYFVKEK